MKNLIPSNVWKSITSTLKKIASADALKAVASKLQDAIPSKFREKIPQKYQKWILPGLALLLILIIALICSIGNNDPVADPVTGTVTASQLEVHKKAKPDSAVLGQLPEGFEVRILEQQTVDGTDWGLTEKTELPDGSKVKVGRGVYPAFRDAGQKTGTCKADQQDHEEQHFCSGHDYRKQKVFIRFSRSEYRIFQNGISSSFAEVDMKRACQ